jgi:phage terminase small subunit
MIDNPSYMLDKNLMIQREKWEKSFNRASNELGLSPQSRAKLGNLNATKASQEADPLLKAIKRVK